MHEVRHFIDWSLLVVSYSDPFSASDLLAVLPAVGSPGNAHGQHRALLIDVRNVSLLGISSSDTRRFVAARKAQLAGVPSEPAAFLIRSDADFAYIRMHNLWSEAMGVRDERNTIITESIQEALSWLETVTNQSGLVYGMLRQLRLSS